MFELLLNFIEAKDSPINLKFLFLHQLIDSFERLDLGKDIGHESDIFIIFMDSQAQNSILSLIGVLIG